MAEIHLKFKSLGKTERTRRCAEFWAKRTTSSVINADQDIHTCLRFAHHSRFTWPVSDTSCSFLGNSSAESFQLEVLTCNKKKSVQTAFSCSLAFFTSINTCFETTWINKVSPTSAERFFESLWPQLCALRVLAKSRPIRSDKFNKTLKVA